MKHTKIRDQHCWICGAESNLKCGSCRNAHYCSIGCQKSHWKHHKEICKVDTEDGMRKVKFRQYSGTCLHGAPPVSDPVATALLPHIQAIIVAYSTDELKVMRLICLSNPTICSDIKASAMILSLASDALQDKNYLICRKFLRAIVTLEAFAAEPNFFMYLCLSPEGENLLSIPVITSWNETIQKSLSVKGMINEILSRVSCNCFK